MLHTKSQGHRPSGSGEEDFLRVFTIYGRGGHLGHVTKTIWTNFRSPILRSVHMKYEFNWPSSFRGEDVWKCWRTTDGRTTDAGVTGILLAHQWAFGSGELKSKGDIVIASVHPLCYFLLCYFVMLLDEIQPNLVCELLTRMGHATTKKKLPHSLGPWGGVKRSNIIKFQLQSQFQRFLYQTLCVFS